MNLLINTQKREETVIKIDEKEFKERGKILPSFLKVLKNQKLAFEEFENISAFKGPGSFTGLRVGCAIVNAVNYSLGRLSSFQNLVLPEYGKEPNISAPKSTTR